MLNLILFAALTLGLSESIETRLPEDPGMVYTVAFTHTGVKVGLDWKNRAILTDRVCRKAPSHQKHACQSAALSWLQEECAYYADKRKLSSRQKDMQQAVCRGAEELTKLN